MRRHVAYFTILLLMLCCRAAAPTGGIDCRVEAVTRIADRSVNVVSKVVCGADGYLWIATWNGLHRYDGTTLAKIPPRGRRNDEVISERFNNVYLAPSGNLWCHVDNRLIVFDVGSLTFDDITADVEAALGRQVLLKRLYKAADGSFLVELENDGGWIHIDETAGASGARFSAERPDFRLASFSNLPVETRRLACDDDAYSGVTPAGETVVSRGGDIFVRPGNNAPFRLVGTIPGADAGRLQFSEQDIDGNLWFTVNGRLIKVTLLQRPASPPAIDGPIRAALVLADGRRIIADTNGDRLAVLNADLTPAGYIDAAGRLSATPAAFGARVYSLAEHPAGTLWVGTKPDGLFRVTDFGTPKASVNHLLDNAAVYDILPVDGALWLATLDRGVARIDKPHTATPAINFIAERVKDYPIAGIRSRHLAARGDTIFAATTGGLMMLSARNPANIKMLKPSAGKVGSLSAVGIIDVMLAGDRLIVATETGGVDVAPVDSLEAFVHLNSSAGRVPDVTRSIAVDPSTGNAIIVSENLIYSFNPASPARSLIKHPMAGGNYNFTEARPLDVGADGWLVGHSAGAILVNPEAKHAYRPHPLHFTSITIHPRPDSLLASTTDTIILSPAERSITLRFAAIEFDNPETVTYLFRFDDSPWTDLGDTRSITMLNLEPGVHTVEIESTMPDGTRAGNLRRLTLVVTPRFIETTTARVLIGLLITAILAAIVAVVIYIRRIKRRQRETLEAYLELVNAGRNAALTDSTPEPQAVAATPAPEPTMSERDRALMDSLVRWIDENMADSAIDVDSMAVAAAMSRSALTRRLKSIINITPAEFLKQSRLRRAATLLKTTDHPVKQVADECGFSDINYFGKCFKAAYSLTPAAYRNNHE